MERINGSSHLYDFERGQMDGVCGEGQLKANHGLPDWSGQSDEASILSITAGNYGGFKHK